MSQIIRQNNLFSAEDWKTIYRSFSQANFTAYDFDTIRSAMLNYIQVNYPEDFNDYIQSSEFIAIIDLLSYLGQSLAFRTDLNARENFLDTAERRDSIIRLAKLINYKTRRNTPARGLLKLTKIRTTEPITDSDGADLSNTNISWNDPNNANWYDQWLTVCNTLFNTTNQFGNPTKSATIGSVASEIYATSSTSDQSVVKNFQTSVDGVSTSIDVVKVDIHPDNYFYERAPDSSEAFNLIYRNDNQGFNSVNTGFFVYFKEGTLQYQDHEFVNPLPNRQVDIDVSDINDTDVWVQKVGTMGTPLEKWTSVPALNGQNTIYNSLALATRNIYTVNSRNNDNITVQFSDGNFGNAPKGNFRIYFRKSSGKGQVLKANRIQNEEVSFNYQNSAGQTFTATMSLTLNYTVDNSSATETNTAIKNNAPQAFYSQDRMVNAEDYSIFPLTQSTTIQKIKAMNRTHIGHSRYLDVNDPTGTVKSVNVVGEDAIVYKSPDFTLTTEEVTGTVIDTSSYSYIIQNKLAPLLKKIQLQNFYFDDYKKSVETHHDSDQFEMDLTSVNRVLWKPYPTAGESETGYFYIGGNDAPSQAITVYNNPNSSDEKLGFIRPGTKLEFVNDYSSPTTVKWATVMSIKNDGSVITTDTTGSITLDTAITSGLKVRKVLPNLRSTLTISEESAIQSLMESGVNFGIGYHYRDTSTKTESWYTISEDYLDKTSDFSVQYNQQHGGFKVLGKDASWLVKATYIAPASSATTAKYEFTIRGLDYVFESFEDVRFFYYDDYKNIDTKTGKAIKDTIKILDINKDVTILSNPSSTTKLVDPITFSLSNAFVEQDGYVDTKKVKITNIDSDDDGMPDNPVAHENIISDSHFVFFVNYTDADGYTYYKLTTGVTQRNALTGNGLEFLTTDQQFYKDNVKLHNGTASKFTKRYGVDGSAIYKAYRGRAYSTSEPFYFQYKHTAPRSQRVDPSVSNVVELTILQTTYYTNVLNWFYSGKGVADLPVQPTSAELKNSLTELEKYKTIGDQIVYSPAKFKLLFGTTANTAYQATFRVVKIPGATFTDNQIKTEVINAINEYFDVSNWNFGDTFYFTELSAYVHAQLSSQISSVVIVPKDSESSFGNLFQIKADSNELFFSTAAVSDVEIVTSLTGANLRAGPGVSSGGSSGSGGGGGGGY